MTLGEKIQLIRKKKGMSQEDLANLLNVSRQAVQKWESDSSVPEIEKLVIISNTFDVSLDWLLKDVEKKNVENSTENPQEEKTAKDSYKNKGISFAAIQGWMIVGIVISPLYIGGSVLHATNYNQLSLLCLLLYLITIPLGIFAIHRVKTATKKSDIIGIGVMSIILISTIGGILILCLRDEQLPFSKPVLIKSQPIIKEEIHQVSEQISDVSKDDKKLTKKQKTTLISIVSSVSVVLLVLIILIPTVFIPAANKADNTPAITDSRSERQKAYDKIMDDIYLYKVSDKAYCKTIKTTTSSYFDKSLEYKLRNNKPYTSQTGLIYLHATGEKWINDEKTSYMEINISIGINRNYGEQTEFIGNCHLDFYDTTSSPSNYVYAYSDARYLTAYSLSNCINLYSITVSKNQTQGLSNEQIKDEMLQQATEAMSSCLVFTNSYAKSFYNINEGLRTFGITCV